MQSPSDQASHRVLTVADQAPPRVAPRTAESARAERQLVVIGLAMLGLTAAGMPVVERFGDLSFNAIALAQGLLALWATRTAARTGGRRALAIILGFALVLQVIPWLDLPTLSTDAYRYVWDGRVQRHGINPYRYIPAAPELASSATR